MTIFDSGSHPKWHPGDCLAYCAYEPGGGGTPRFPKTALTFIPRRPETTLPECPARRSWAGLDRVSSGYSCRVQTFLPYPDFAATAEVLDIRRLGKQRVEALQVLRGLTVPGYGWRHHPAVKMWAGYEESLVRYGLEVCRVWAARGYADTCATSLTTQLGSRCGVSVVRPQPALAATADLPPWLGDPTLHRSHRAALLRKDPLSYRAWFGHVPVDIPYVWPLSDRSPACLP